MNDIINENNLNQMIKQLVALSEFTFTDRNDGSRKLYNVK